MITNLIGRKTCSLNLPPENRLPAAENFGTQLWTDRPRRAGCHHTYCSTQYSWSCRDLFIKAVTRRNNHNSPFHLALMIQGSVHQLFLTCTKDIFPSLEQLMLSECFRSFVLSVPFQRMVRGVWGCPAELLHMFPSRLRGSRVLQGLLRSGWEDNRATEGATRR